MKILLVDDHPLIGKSLELTLKGHPEVSEFLFLPEPERTLDVLNTYCPSIVLMDIHLGKFNGLDLGQKILEKFPVKLVFLSGFNLIEYRNKAFEIGAHGFLDKHIAIEELMENLKFIESTEKKVFSELNLDNANPSLTKREKEILQLLSQGVKQTAVASMLDISERTVRNHVYSINEKLQTSTVVEAVIKAIELGIVNVKLQ